MLLDTRSKWILTVSQPVRDAGGQLVRAGWLESLRGLQPCGKSFNQPAILDMVMINSGLTNLTMKVLYFQRWSRSNLEKAL
jgi:hypothetical protein